MEPWKSNFVLGCYPILKTVVWLRLSGLSLEFWMSIAIMAIAAKARRSLAIDDFIDLLRKIGYEWVRVEIDAGKPLMPGILIQGNKEPF